ncbi:PP-loop domain containing protein [Aphelenchoides bicaudatus]|nr:PP-loop domain containing protein [Aphelenchoides bicaudatus]
MKCETCDSNAKIKVAKNGSLRCAPCFILWFEDDVYETIKQTGIFKPKDRIAIGVSGGKDSTVLAHILHTLNDRHQLELELLLVCIDEGIQGKSYRDDSIREVKKNKEDLQLPLLILSYKDLYGWSMDEIVAKIGKKNNCTFCGVFRRQALDRGAFKLGANKVVTGHNADDLAETVLLNVFRGDMARLQRCTSAFTGTEGDLPRVKPFKFSFEKDIVMYAHHRKLNYFCTECKYAPNSFRSYARTLIKDLERERPQSILDLIYSGDSVSVKESARKQVETRCERCNYICSNRICKACTLLYGLNQNDTSIGVKKGSSIPTSEIDAYAAGTCGDCPCDNKQKIEF